MQLLLPPLHIRTYKFPLHLRRHFPTRNNSSQLMSVHSECKWVQFLPGVDLTSSLHVSCRVRHYHSTGLQNINACSSPIKKVELTWTFFEGIVAFFLSGKSMSLNLRFHKSWFTLHSRFHEVFSSFQPLRLICMMDTNTRAVTTFWNIFHTGIMHLQLEIL